MFRNVQVNLSGNSFLSQVSICTKSLCSFPKKKWSSSVIVLACFGSFTCFSTSFSKLETDVKLSRVPMRKSFGVVLRAARPSRQRDELKSVRNQRTE